MFSDLSMVDIYLRGASYYYFCFLSTFIQSYNLWSSFKFKQTFILSVYFILAYQIWWQ